MAAKFGLVHRLPDDLLPVYAAFETTFSGNGDQSLELPITATYVIDTHGNDSKSLCDGDIYETARS